MFQLLFAPYYVAPGYAAKRGWSPMNEGRGFFTQEELNKQSDRYLGKLRSGEWMGTMALSEPHAGSSLANIRTVASPWRWRKGARPRGGRSRRRRKTSSTGG